MLLICTTASVCLYVGYRGVFEMLASRWAPALAAIVLSGAAGLAAVQLCRHRNDLLS
jgi:hypothetical protein